MPQALFDGGAGGGRFAERSQQILLGVEAAPVQECPRPAVRVPRFCRGDKEARIILSLEQVAKEPLAVGGEAVAVAFGVRLLQAEAEAEGSRPRQERGTA